MLILLDKIFEMTRGGLLEYTRVRTHANAHAHTHARAHTQTRTHARTHTHTHTHTHTYALQRQRVMGLLRQLYSYDLPLCTIFSRLVNRSVHGYSKPQTFAYAITMISRQY